MRISLRSNLNLVLVLAIAAMATYWVLQFSGGSSIEEPAIAISTSDRKARTQPLNTSAVAGLFGAIASETETSQIMLIGVISEGGTSSGVALLSVANRPAVPVRVGETIEGNIVLVDVAASHVVIERSDGLAQASLPGRIPPSGIELVQQ